MAGPSIVVRVLGDLKGLSGSFNDAGKQAEKATARVRGAFTSVLGTLNRTGILGPFGESLAQVDETLERVAEHGKSIGTVMLGLGGTLTGVGLGLQAIGSKDQAAHQQLQAAVEATGKSYEDYEKQVESAIKTQEKYGHTANQTQDALRVLTQATHDPGKALQLLATASNVAAAKHEDLTTAATQVGKVFNGNTKLLKEYGITVDKTTKKTEDGKTATQALAEVTAGQASAAADTFTGKLEAVKAHVEDLAAAFGQKYGPAITAGGAAITALGAAIEIATAVSRTFAGSQEAAAAAQEAMTVATGAEAAALDAEAGSAVAAEAASLPLIATIGLIVLAVAALGAIAYVLYRNWTTIWAGIKRIVVDVFNWIKNNWPLLLAILAGPFGLAVLEIVRHWNDILDFFKAIPGRIASIAKGMWNGIANAFVDMINFVIHIWNSLQFKIPSVGFGPFRTPGFTLGLPNIPDVPHLAQGGLLTRDGLVFAHAGEVIAPIEKVRTGPAVAIANAHFSSDVDVDLFMRRVAWTVQTQNI